MALNTISHQTIPASFTGSPSWREWTRTTSQMGPLVRIVDPIGNKARRRPWATLPYAILRKPTMTFCRAGIFLAPWESISIMLSLDEPCSSSRCQHRSNALRDSHESLRYHLDFSTSDGRLRGVPLAEARALVDRPISRGTTGSCDRPSLDLRT